MLGIRKLQPEEYKQIDEKLSTARKAMVDRERKVGTHKRENLKMSSCWHDVETAKACYFR